MGKSNEIVKWTSEGAYSSTRSEKHGKYQISHDPVGVRALERNPHAAETPHALRYRSKSGGTKHLGSFKTLKEAHARAQAHHEKVD